NGQRGLRAADRPGGRTQNILLKTLRNAQVRRISWVRGVRPARGRCEWPPHDTASGRPPSQLTVAAVFHRSGYRPARAGRAQGDRPDMSLVEPPAGIRFEDSPIVVVGAGAAGLCAALSAAEAGAEVVVLERDALPAGSTALSAGLIPAAGTSFQRAKAIDDSPHVFAADVQRKAAGEADPELVDAICDGARATIEWLADSYGF